MTRVPHIDETVTIGGDLTVGRRIGHGAMQLTGPKVWGEYPDHDGGVALLRHAVDSGVTFIDTADVYGDGRSEQLIGRFLRTRDATGITVATKMGRRVALDPALYTVDNFRAWTDRSRANLGVDTLDLVQLHCPPSAVFADDRDLAFAVYCGRVLEKVLRIAVRARDGRGRSRGSAR